MDLETKLKTDHAKWIGLLLALFVPGMAHYLSGKRKVGILLFLAVSILPILGILLATVPTMASIYIGLVLLAIASPALGIYILIASWRPIPKMPRRRWAAVIGSILLLSVINGALEMVIPITTYKIPTGAMQPTLMGVHTIPELEDTSFLDRLFFGRHAETYKALASGNLTQPSPSAGEITFNIANTKHHLPSYAMPRSPQRNYNEGDVFWSGTVIMGDFVLADKSAYLFKEPVRGDIVTFSTSEIDHPSVRRDTIYVKRIVGLPGETIGIRNGKIIVNGKAVTSPDIFQSLEYGNDGDFSDEIKTITLGPDEYLTLGDNTAPNMSLDGRYYGPIQADSIISKVRTIYWPLNRIRVVE